MELICWDGLRVTRDVSSTSAQDDGPARLHPVKGAEGKRAAKHLGPRALFAEPENRKDCDEHRQ